MQFSEVAHRPPRRVQHLSRRHLWRGVATRRGASWSATPRSRSFGAMP